MRPIGASSPHPLEIMREAGAEEVFLVPATAHLDEVRRVAPLVVPFRA